jgi:hypothetical protein
VFVVVTTRDGTWSLPAKNRKDAEKQALKLSLPGAKVRIESDVPVERVRRQLKKFRLEAESET